MNENEENLEKIKMKTKNWLREYEPLLNNYGFARTGTAFKNGFIQDTTYPRYFYIFFGYKDDPFTLIDISYDSKFERFSANLILDHIENGKRKEYKRLSIKELFSLLNEYF